MKQSLLTFLFAIVILLPAPAQAATKDRELVPMADSISNYLREKTTVRSYVSVEKATVLKDGTLRLTLSRSLVDHPLRDREIADLMDRALELLETPSLPRDGYYDFVREKCAPAFAHYGYIL